MTVIIAPATIGVIGGMGPLATADLYRKIIETTLAEHDQDHLHVIIDANPTIPDRTAALLENGPDPLPQMVSSAKRLQRAGAHVLAVPCNTAHAFFPQLSDHISTPILDMVRETSARAAICAPGAGSIGVLATAGTIQAALYERQLAELGIRAINPDRDSQQRVSDGIAAVKGDESDRAATLFLDVSRRLIDAGAEALIAGCSEIPIVLSGAMSGVPLIDCTQALAEAAVHWALDHPVPVDSDLNELAQPGP